MDDLKIIYFVIIFIVFVILPFFEDELGWLFAPITYPYRLLVGIVGILGIFEGFKGPIGIKYKEIIKANKLSPRHKLKNIWGEIIAIDYKNQVLILIERKFWIIKGGVKSDLFHFSKIESVRIEKASKESWAYKTKIIIVLRDVDKPIWVFRPYRIKYEIIGLAKLEKKIEEWYHRLAQLPTHASETSSKKEANTTKLEIKNQSSTIDTSESVDDLIDLNPSKSLDEIRNEMQNKDKDS